MNIDWKAAILAVIAAAIVVGVLIGAVAYGHTLWLVLGILGALVAGITYSSLTDGF